MWLITLITLSGQVIAQDLNDDEEFLDTPEGPTEMDNTFMGYSIAVGHFDDDSEQGENHTRNYTVVLNTPLILIHKYKYVYIYLSIKY